MVKNGAVRQYYFKTKDSAMKRTVTEQAQTSSISGYVSANLTAEAPGLVSKPRIFWNPHLPFAPRSMGIMWWCGVT